MQLRYVFTELGQGLRRNVSMHLAVVLTLFVSLTLVGMGALLNKQAERTSDYWGDQLQIIVYLCNGSNVDSNPNCAGEITDAQRQAVQQTIETNPEVDSVRFETQQQAFDKMQEMFSTDDVIKPENMPESFWVTLKDPREYEGVTSAVVGLDGVATINDMRDQMKPVFDIIDVFKYGSWAIAAFLVVAALLLVANTIRLAAFARRKEIGIMRLVGASTLYIALPFLLEALVTALVGVAMAAAALWGVMHFGVEGRLVDSIRFIPWVGQSELNLAILVVAVLGPLLTLVPTLVLTRKYLKV